MNDILSDPALADRRWRRKCGLKEGVASGRGPQPLGFLVPQLYLKEESTYKPLALYFVHTFAASYPPPTYTLTWEKALIISSRSLHKRLEGGEWKGMLGTLLQIRESRCI